jgi:multidrug resistance efflux pump
MSSTVQQAPLLAGPTPDDAGPARQAWWPVKRLVLGGFWTVAGTSVIVYAGVLLYGRLARIEIDSAVVAGQVEPLKAPAAGVMTALPAEPGGSFDAGAVLFRVDDPDLDEAIGLQRVKVDQARADLRLAEATLAAERGRRDDFIVTQRLEIEKSERLVEDLNDQVTTLTARCAELTELFKKGISPNWRLHDAQDKLAPARQALSQARVVLKEQRALLALAESGQGLDGVEVIGRLAELTEGFALAKTELALSEKTLVVLLERQAKASSIAAGPGRVLRVLRLAGSQVQIGDTVAVIERTSRRFIYAYMTQDEIGRVSVGDTADIYLPAQRLSGRARIAAIERAGAYLDDVQTRYDWRVNRDDPLRLTDRDRTARVTLDFTDADHRAAEQIAAVGTPVVVSFSRHWRDLIPGFTALAADTAIR